MGEHELERWSVRMGEGMGGRGGGGGQKCYLLSSSSGLERAAEMGVWCQQSPLK